MSITHSTTTTMSKLIYGDTSNHPYEYGSSSTLMCVNMTRKVGETIWGTCGALRT